MKLKLAVLLLLLPLPAAAVGLSSTPKFTAQGVEVEISTMNQAGLRVTSVDGLITWLWTDGDGGVHLTVHPIRPGDFGSTSGPTVENGALVWKHKLPWPGPCPCKVEITDGGEPAITWTEIDP